MPFILPVSPLRQTETLLAFHHPRPAYPLHVILLPRRDIPALDALDPAADGPFLADLFAVVQDLVREFGLAGQGYRLIVNGGAFQEFPHLHFHLVSDHGPGAR